MQDFAAQFQQTIQQISADCQNINIINAGIMNHGKSSLFNSLLDKNAFASQDVRTTIQNQDVNWRDNVYLIDTPGLEAEISDDNAAFAAYQRANMIVFVHNLKVGELHSKELDAINKIKALFQNDDFFCKHFCLALTFKEADSDESITAIRTKTLADIQTHCGISNFPTFIVSNSRYQKGVAENKSALVRHSGIPELRDFLIKNFPTWNSENNYFRNMRITNAKNELVAQLQQERTKIQARIDAKTSEIKQRQNSLLQEMETANAQANAAFYEYDSANSRLEDMKSELKNMKQNWRNSRANYDD